MIDKDRIRHFRSFLPAGRQARSFHDRLPVFIYGFLLFELRAKKPLKYHILSPFLSVITRNMLLVILLILACHLLLVASVHADTPKRIISLAPNMTELLFELGLGERIVGVTSFCDYPEAARNKKKVGGMSNPSLEAVVSLKPEVVVMTTDGNPKEFAEKLKSLDIKTYIFRARRIAELPGAVREMGTALGAKEKSEKIEAETEIALNRFSLRSDKSAERRTPDAELKKKVLFIVWPEPLIVAGQGTVINDAINILGGENIAAKAKAVYPKYSVEEILRESPDMIFIGNMNEEIRKISENLLRKLKTVSAVKNNKVFFVSDLLYRLGPRTVKGMEELAEHMDK